MHESTAYISLGSNKGDRFRYLQQAVSRIKKNPGCRIDLISSVYETKPMGSAEPGNYLNAVMKTGTSMPPKELFNFIKDIEKKTGRTESVKWGPREIDLDLLLYDDLIYSDDELSIPHKGLTLRDFVLVPLCEISPGIIHPELKQKICDISIKDSEKYIISKLPQELDYR